MEKIYHLANTYWNLWLAIVFFAIVVKAYWPTKKTQEKMDKASRIPLQDD